MAGSTGRSARRALRSGFRSSAHARRRAFGRASTAKKRSRFHAARGPSEGVEAQREGAPLLRSARSRQSLLDPLQTVDSEEGRNPSAAPRRFLEDARARPQDPVTWCLAIFACMLVVLGAVVAPAARRADPAASQRRADARSAVRGDAPLRS